MLMPKKSNGCTSSGQQRGPGHPSIQRNSPPRNHPKKQTLHNSNASVINCQLRRYYDWQVELYFRVIKQLFGCRHSLSTKSERVTIQFYMAIIACIMILSITGKTPTKRTYEMLCYYLLGWATFEDLEGQIKKLKSA